MPAHEQKKTWQKRHRGHGHLHGHHDFCLQADERTSFAILDRAVDAGVDFFDTAEVYPVPPSEEKYGVTEEIVGRWMKGKNREHIILATKVIGPGHGWFRPPV